MEAVGERPLSRQAVLAALPPEWPTDPLTDIRRHVDLPGSKIAVLDDDPTGTQTVHGISVLTRWHHDALVSAFADPSPLFYLLTNSRSLTEERAIALNAEIAAALVEAAAERGHTFDVMSRSDSTLRGHFPAETDALDTALSRGTSSYDGLVLSPAFPEGGRITVHDVHWVAEGEMLVPCGLTEYARDAVFGYTNSNLCHWVSEKTQGRIPAERVLSLSLETIRLGGPDAVAQRLMDARDGQPVVVNAVTYRDLGVCVAGLLAAERRGKRFLVRTAASLVKVRGAIPDRELLTAREMRAAQDAPGLVVIGSHVQRTTEQLARAREQANVAALELRVSDVLDPDTRSAEIARVSLAAGAALGAGRDTIVYTSRERARGEAGVGALDIARRVSTALTEVVRRIRITPGYVIAKGGITSSDIATDALGVHRALVLGQILPGVPVWRLGPESRYPDLPYVVFPGNVGTAESLAEAMRILAD